MSELIAKIDRSDRDDIRISLSDFRRKKYIDIRSYFEVEKGKDRKPTRKGVTFSVELYPQFKKAIKALEDSLLAKALIEKEDLD